MYKVKFKSGNYVQKIETFKIWKEDDRFFICKHTDKTNTYVKIEEIESIQDWED